MSSNFTGITFPKQKVAPSDDAIIRRAILPDGILTGCDISYSGSTLTMAAGQLMICGRQVRHPSSQNWAVVDATSGYARLLLTIDVTRTSTKDVFDQVLDTIEYATSIDGFPDLATADINVSGTRYQVVACVVSLGAGGITGIESQLGKSAVDGAGVNFKVVGGTTQPTDPSENTIWVNTDTAISGWAFSASAPTEPAEGLVWLTVGTSSSVAFNALKKNGLQVYPISAMQYIGSRWTGKTAKSYIGGKWVDWWNGELYKSGKEFGGWAYVPMALNTSYKAANEPTVNKGAASMKITQTAYKSCCAYVYNDEVDLTSFDTLSFDGVLSTAMTAFADAACLCIWTSLGTYVADNRVAYINFNTASPKNIDVTALTGKHRIGFFLFSTDTYAEVNSLLLE